LVVHRHHDRREARADIFVERLALAGMAIRRRHAGAVALDREARRLMRCVDAVIDEIRQFVREPFGLVFGNMRHPLVARVEPQPDVQELALLDRFHDRRVGADEIQGDLQFDEAPQRIDGRGKFSMNAICQPKQR